VTWQLGVSDVDAVITACQQAGLRFELTVERPREDWTYRIVKVRSPNGMAVLLEEQAPPKLRPEPHRPDLSPSASVLICRKWCMLPACVEASDSRNASWTS
jgi:hypothetical protein